MTLDELDGAFQRGTISEQTLVAREDENCLRPLGVVAGLFEEEHRDAPPSHVSGVRPATYAQRDLPESLVPNGSAWLLEHSGHPAPRLAEESIAVGQRASLRWLHQAQAVLCLLTGRATAWFALRAPHQRWALAGLLVASLAAVCAFWPAQRRPPVPSAHLATHPPSAPVRTATVAAVQDSLLPAPSSTANTPWRAVEPGAEPDVPMASAVARRTSTFAERRKAGRSERGRRASRSAKVSNRRAGRD